MKKNNNNISNEEAIITASDEKQISKLGVDLTNENICCELFIAAETFSVFNILKIESYHI